jgi:Membrane bound FAD containing D-sorbitol dehydrogenase
MADVAAFRKFSQAITGFDNLDQTIAAAYAARIEEAFPKPLADLMAAFAPVSGSPDLEAAVTKILTDNPKLVAMTRQIAEIWYTSQFTRDDGSLDPPENEDQFKYGLLWKTIGAVAPAFSDRPYGYWKDKPTNLP